MSPYFVEVTPGRELLYRTPLALRVAIRSGEITADSRIFHRATSRWISITKHPEYRRFLAERTPPPWVDRPPSAELVVPLPAESVVPPPAELVVPPRVPKQRGFFRSLAEVGAELATSGWASLKERFDSGSAKTARSPNGPASSPNRPARSSKPVPGAQPSQPDQPTEAQDPGPARKGWTFYP